MTFVTLRKPTGRPLIGRVAMTAAERMRRHRAKIAKRRYRTKFTGNFEWNTPQEYVELARPVLGIIDLDPASNAVAQETVKAAKCFTLEDDGLKQEWRGGVWMNPPYSQPEISLFIDKLLDEFAAGRVTEAIVLTNNSSDAAWFQRAAAGASSICFPARRIRFVAPDGSLGSPPQGQTFFYFGQNASAFDRIFAAKGRIVPGGGRFP